MLRSNAPSQRLRKRIRDLQTVSSRIETKMEKLEKIIADISKGTE